MASSKNSEYQKTSFLSKSNSAFIEQMYLKFINRESDLPESWEKYFLEIGEEFEIIAKEINGPSWNPIKKKINLDMIQESFEKEKNSLHNFLWLTLVDRKNEKVIIQKIIKDWINKFNSYRKDIWKESIVPKRIIAW